jgi:prepilin-type N-terminal cleavage/methylation domain-containing protein
MSPRRTAFTLIEMLVVIAIIVTLASILVPTISLAKRMVQDMKCGHQLQQLAGAMLAYEADNDDKFPGRLRYMVKNGMVTDRLLLCPRDPHKGTGGVNRPWDAITNSGEIYTAEAPCSYLYEVSETKLSAGLFDYFYFGKNWPDPPPAAPTDPDLMPTWLDAKREQLRSGNSLVGDTAPKPFPGSVMPIIRCFWHEKWSRNGTVLDADKQLLKRVKNVSWDCSVFESIPQWEHQANPAIPLE